MIETADIKENAALVIKSCQDLVDFEFGFDERSVAWLADYIEQLKARGFFQKDSEGFASILGCYLGEAIIATYGGYWHGDGKYPLHVVIKGDLKLFPFAKVHKQIAHGVDAGDSIAGLYRSVPAILTMTRSQP